MRLSTNSDKRGPRAPAKRSFDALEAAVSLWGRTLFEKMRPAVLEREKVTDFGFESASLEAPDHGRI